MTTMPFFTGGNAKGCNIDSVLQCWSQSSITEILRKFSSEVSLKTLNAQFAVDEFCRLVLSDKYQTCTPTFDRNRKEVLKHKLVRFLKPQHMKDECQT